MLDDIFSSNLDQDLFDAICEPSFNLSDTLFSNSNSECSDFEIGVSKIETNHNINTNSNSNIITNSNINANNFISQESDFSDNSNNDRKLYWDLDKSIDFGIVSGSDNKPNSPLFANNRKRGISSDDRLQEQVNGTLGGLQVGTVLLPIKSENKAALNGGDDLVMKTENGFESKTRDEELEGSQVPVVKPASEDLKKGTKGLGNGFKKRKMLITISQPNSDPIKILSTKIVKVETKKKHSNTINKDGDEAKKSSKSGKTSKKKKNKKKHKKKKKKNRKKNNKKTAVTTEEDARRQLVLERNRINAKKSRERKKIYVANLENTTKELQEKNHELTDEIVKLNNENENLNKEISKLKILLKGNCQNLLDPKVLENLVLQLNNNINNDNNNNNETLKNHIFETLASSIMKN
ncbi:transcriptional activator hac1 [Anaeramoeba flamelloides]|uniref:Transcriptional activator hac1 n=1 Tax=Anaeramoeba flamelloides TaxID=1746091 RepID=A0AAV7Y5U8_9EUKA|nr:transcriptional activator hac1 [Anaeramoeba flamelloides]